MRDLANYSVNLASVILFHALHLNDFHRCIKEALEFLYSPPFSVCMYLRLAALLDLVFVSLHASTLRTFLDISASNPMMYVGCSCPHYFNQLPSKLEISSTRQRRESGYRVLLVARNTRNISIFSSSISLAHMLKPMFSRSGECRQASGRYHAIFTFCDERLCGGQNS